jgi:hypothetical protein
MMVEQKADRRVGQLVAKTVSLWVAVLVDL